MEIYKNLLLTFDLHLDGLHRYDPQSIIKTPRNQTIPQLDTPTWSYNFMYYGIVLVDRVSTL